MPRFAANLTMLFGEVSFLDRFELAASAGFSAVEFLFPYAWSAAEIKQRLDANGLTLVLHNLPAGDWEAGERGIACHPSRVDEFRAGVFKAIEYAKALGVTQLNCLAGKTPAGVPAEVLHQTLVANLRFASAELKKADLKYVTKYSKLNKPNRVYVPGNDINVTWADTVNEYAFNDENGHWFKITDKTFSKTYCQVF